MTILNALKGASGEFEVQRVLGAFGTIAYIITAPSLVWARIVQTSFEGFCLAYPAGLAACVGATAGAIALKDRQLAKAKAEGL
jgi:hypothetical protein